MGLTGSRFLSWILPCLRCCLRVEEEVEEVVQAAQASGVPLPEEMSAALALASRFAPVGQIVEMELKASQLGRPQLSRQRTVPGVSL